MTETKESPTKPAENLDKTAQTGFFNISSVARNRISEKRKRKGLGELKKREDNVWSQFFKHGLSAVAVHCAVAPIERVRII